MNRIRVVLLGDFFFGVKIVEIQGNFFETVDYLGLLSKFFFWFVDIKN